MRLHVILICVIFSFCLSAYAQNTFKLNIQSIDSPELVEKLTYKKTFTGSKEREKELVKVLNLLYDDAFLAATYDSLRTDSTSQTAFLNFGMRYKWAQLSKGNIEEGVLSEVGFRESLYRNKPIYYKKVKVLQEKLIRFYENNGYPFVSVKLDSVVIGEDKISAVLNLNKNEKIIIDSIEVKGTAKISDAYIYNYIGIMPNSLYDESKIKKVNTRLKELAFLKPTQESVVKFTNNGNKLLLFVDKKKASKFDGIVGVLPDNKTDKIIFTGDVRLNLENGLGRGEQIDLNWRRLQTETQDLKLHVQYPFVFRLPFGIDYSLKLYKRDTTFIDVNQQIALQYILIGGNYVEVYYNNKVSSLLSTSGLEKLTSLPPYADIKNNSYGMGAKYERLDYRLNPRRGFSVLANAGVGVKTIVKNSNIDSTVYLGLNLKSTQYNGNFVGSIFIPILGRSTFKVGNQSGFFAGETIFQNELFRIGGLKTLRGFNEESIFASSYSIFTLEYRFILEQNSYLYVFGDGAWYENNSVNTYEKDTPFGFGAGVSFETKAGIFSINYALGKQFDNPIQFRDGKVHFGLVNYF